MKRINARLPEDLQNVSVSGYTGRKTFINGALESKADSLLISKSTKQTIQTVQNYAADSVPILGATSLSFAEGRQAIRRPTLTLAGVDISDSSSYHSSSTSTSIIPQHNHYTRDSPSRLESTHSRNNDSSFPMQLRSSPPKENLHASVVGSKRPRDMESMRSFSELTASKMTKTTSHSQDSFLQQSSSSESSYQIQQYCPVSRNHNGGEVERRTSN